MLAGLFISIWQHALTALGRCMGLTCMWCLAAWHGAVHLDGFSCSQGCLWTVDVGCIGWVWSGSFTGELLGLAGGRSVGFSWRATDNRRMFA